MQIDEEAERRRTRRLMQDPDAYFVFGSNTAGIHGAGAAAFAVARHGAVYGRGEGLQGRSYALPTKDSTLHTLSTIEVDRYVSRFLLLASLTQDFVYVVTRIGCGLAGFTDEEIAPMFRHAPANVKLPIGWRTFNGEAEDEAW